MDRRRKNPAEKRYQVSQLADLHLEILRLLALGVKPKDISRKLKISTQTVSNVRNLPEARKMLQLMHAGRNLEVTSIKERIETLLPKAIDVMEELMERSPSDGVRRAAARDILGIAGYNPNGSVVAGSQGLSIDEINQIISRGVEKGFVKLERVRGEIEEANVVEEEVR